MKRDRVIERTEHLSRSAPILACEVVVQASKSACAAREGSIRRDFGARPGRVRAATLQRPRRMTFSISSHSTGTKVESHPDFRNRSCTHCKEGLAAELHIPMQQQLN